MDLENLLERAEDAEIKCQICTKSVAKYTCPKCNAPYCTLECYKSQSHNACSETFYQECVITELSTNTKDASSSDVVDPKKEMFNILQRCAAQDPNLDEMLAASMDYTEQCEMGAQIDSDDDEPVADIADRMEGVNLDNPDKVWERLTKDERKNFEDMVNSGEIVQLIPNWTPWWCLKTITGPIEDLDHEEDYAYREYCPKHVKITDFKDISQTPPSDDVKYNILNILSSFTYTMRTYNGDHFEYINESVYLLYFLSKNLKSGKNFQDPMTAINDIIDEAAHCCLVIFDDSNFTVLPTHCAQIINGPNSTEPLFYTLAALSEIYKMLIALKKRNQRVARQREIDLENRRRLQPTIHLGPPPDEMYGDDPNEDPADDPAIQIPKEKLKLITKKMEYYMAYVKTYGLSIKF